MNCVSNEPLVGLVSMNFGTAIAAVVIANLFDKNGESDTNPLRPSKRAPGTRGRGGQRGSNSFAAHPERW